VAQPATGGYDDLGTSLVYRRLGVNVVNSKRREGFLEV
jgi:hypothetical protein